MQKNKEHLACNHLFNDSFIFTFNIFLSTNIFQALGIR